MKTDKISICIATYNGEKYIKQQLVSIINQLPHEYDEVIISDDNSSDNTISKIKEIKDDRIVIYNSKSRNVILNFQNAINKSSGNYIFLSDQDDIWSDNKIEIFSKELQTNLMVFSNLILFNDEGNINFDNALYKKGTNQSGIIKNFIKNRYTGATMAFRRELIHYALPFPKNIPMHDIWLGLLAEWYGHVKYVDEPLLFYRKHENNLSETGRKSSKSLSERTKMRLNLFLSFMQRICFKK